MFKVILAECAFELGSFADWVMVVLTGIGLCFAYKGFKVWEQEMKGRRRYELALKLIGIVDMTFQEVLKLRECDLPNSPFNRTEVEKSLREYHAELTVASFEAHVHWPELHDQMKPFLDCITDAWTRNNVTPMAVDHSDEFSRRSIESLARVKAFLLPIVRG